jgi:hypothetical protein
MPVTLDSSLTPSPPPSCQNAILPSVSRPLRRHLCTTLAGPPHVVRRMRGGSRKLVVKTCSPTVHQLPLVGYAAPRHERVLVTLATHGYGRGSAQRRLGRARLGRQWCVAKSGSPHSHCACWATRMNSTRWPGFELNPLYFLDLFSIDLNFGNSYLS